MSDFIASARAVIEAERCEVSYSDGGRFCVRHESYLRRNATQCDIVPVDLLDTATQLLAVVEAVDHLCNNPKDAHYPIVAREHLRAALTPKED